MASDNSFDIVSKVDYQEAANAIDQAKRELIQRYDLKNTKSEIEFQQKEDLIVLISENDYTLNSVNEILKSKMIKRQVPIKALNYGDIKEAGGNTVRQEITIQNGIPKEKAKDIIKDIKDLKLKVQAQIQEDQLRISGKNRDDLQAVIAMVRAKDYGIHVSFTNYR